MKKTNLKHLATLLSLLFLVACNEYKTSKTESNSGTSTQNALVERVVIEETTVSKKLSPTELTVEKGTLTNAGIETLSAKEQNPGDTNIWDNYIELKPAINDTFSGIFHFKIEGEISKIETLVLKLNFLGYKSDVQAWKIEAKDQVSGEWVQISDNSNVVGWTWSEVVADLDQPENFVAADGSILIRYSSEAPIAPEHNMDSYLDYMVLDVTYLAR